MELKIYNTLGQEVKTLISGQQPAGFYTLTWDGANNTGARVASGVYMYRIKVGDFTDTKKMILLK